MNEKFYNPENIEAYITNKMSAGEKIFFEKELAKDPLLNSEIDIQRDIVEAIKSNRKTQLKSRLNNIKIETHANYAGLKVAASILLAGLISYGGYNYSNNKKENQVVANNNNTISNNASPIVITENNSNKNKETAVTNTAKETNNTVSTDNGIRGTVITKNQVGDKTTYTKTSRTIITQRRVVESNSVPVFNTPEVKDRFAEGDGIQTDANINMPKGDVVNSNVEGGLDNLKVKTVKDKNLNLFYQYYSNKLFLYGDFDSKPYEILELNTLKDKQLYLFFEGSYYGLNQNQVEITSLSLIKDKETITNLELIRNK